MLGAKEEKPESEAEQKAEQKDPNLAVVERIRDLAKWLVIAFGAIGGVLIAGTELADLSSAEGWDLLWACLGVLIGVSGAALALAFTVIVLLPTQISLRRLAEEEETSKLGKMVRKEPELLYNCGETIAEFREVVKKAEGDAETAAEAYERNESDAALKRQFEKATKYCEEVRGAVNGFLSFALVTAVKEKMVRAAVATFVGGFLVVVGIGVFSMATEHEDPPAQTVEAVPKQPSSVMVTLSDHGREMLGEQLGESCRAEQLEAIALEGSPDALQLVSVPTASCEAVRFTLTDSVGEVVSEESVEALPACQADRPKPPCIVTY